MQYAEIAPQPGQQSKTPSQKEKQNCQAWWCASVVPATQEAEVEGLFEPRRVQGAVSQNGTTTLPLHSSLGDRARPCLKKKKRKKM